MPRSFILSGLSCLLLGSCLNEEDSADIPTLEVELADLRHQTKALRDQYNSISREERDLDNLIRRHPENERNLFNQERSHLPLKRYIELLGSSIEYHQNDIEKLKRAHRNSIIGLKTAFLIKSDGTRIPNAEIKEITDEYIVVNSNGTEQTIPIRDLALPVRTKLLYEPDLITP